MTFLFERQGMSTTPIATPSRYMGEPVTLVTAPNGARINASIAAILPKVRSMQNEARNVAPGIWQLMGFSLVYSVVIEGDDGLIVWDTGDNAEEGERIAEQIRQLSPKPVKALIYSHSHYGFGAGCIAQAGPGLQVIAHPAVMANVADSGGWGAVIAELSPVLTARAVQQFNNLLPRSGPDAPLEGTIEDKPKAFLPVTHPVSEGQVMTVCGVKLQFFTRYGSDTDDNLTVWLPERGVALNNLYWPVQPNLYSPRGAKYRDPLIWREGLRELRDLQPSLLLSTHTLPVSGQTEVRQALNAYMDGLTLIYDQTLRGILQGRSAAELRQFVRLPPSLAGVPNLFEGYGELHWIPPNIYSHALGWFDGDAANLCPVPPQAEAQRIVALAGGVAKVAEAARLAVGQEEFSWAAQLANYLLRLDARDATARQIKADALRAMGHRALGTIPRAWYLSQARALEGQVQIPALRFPTEAELMLGPVSTMIDLYRVRIDPERANSMDMLVRFDIEGHRCAWHVRHGIAEFIADPTAYPRPADLQLNLDRTTLARLFVAKSCWPNEIASGHVTVSQGTQAAALALLDLFDDFSHLAN